MTELLASGGALSDRAATDATKANLAVYADPRLVTDYVADPYHATRRQVAQRLLGEALADAPPGPVLEVGSGGRSMVDGVARGRRRIVADANEAVLPSDGVRLDVGERLPFADASLAAVVMGELIEHLYAPPAVLGEFHRVLRPGGVLILTTPNLAPVQDRLRFLIGQSPRQVDCLHPYLHLHIRPFTASSLRHLLNRSGFAISALRSNYVGWQLPGGRWVQSRALARLVPSWGGSLIVSALRL